MNGLENKKFPSKHNLNDLGLEDEMIAARADSVMMSPNRLIVPILLLVFAAFGCGKKESAASQKAVSPPAAQSAPMAGKETTPSQKEPDEDPNETKALEFYERLQKMAEFTGTDAEVAETKKYGFADSRLSISGDGARVAFSVTVGKTHQIYLYDRSTNTVTLVSATPDQKPGNEDSAQPCISADGNIVAFASHATDLLPTGPTTGLYHYNVASKQMTLVTINPEGRPSKGVAKWPALNSDGSVVAFLTTAEDLPGIRKTRKKMPASSGMRLYVCLMKEKRFVLLGNRKEN